MRQRKQSERVHGATSAVAPRSSRPANAAGEDQSNEVSPAVKARVVGLRRSFGGLVEALLAAVVMGVYLKTLYPSVAGGDSGELVAESCHLGVSHPPGYPLFNMLVFLVTSYLPLDQTKAWKANAFSAACDVVAVVVMYRTLLMWTSASASPAFRTTAAFTASALFAFSPLIWTYAVGAEVFALNNLFASALIHTLLQYSTDRSLRLAMRGALLCGLAMCNQHTIILFEIPIIGWVFWTRRKTLWWRELALLALAFIIGLLPYVYMPLTAIFNPQPGSWGDVSTLSGFLRHLRRADYGTFRLFSTTQATEDLWTRLKLYSIDLSAREAPFHVAFPLALVGMFASSSRSYLPVSQDVGLNTVGQVVAGMYAFYMLVFHALANLPLSEGLTYGVHMRFWQQPNIVVFLWVGIGLNTLLHHLSRHLPQQPVRLLACVAVLSLVVIQVTHWFEFCDQSQAFYIRNYASALLDPLPLNALLFVNFDLQWTALRYLQRCEQRRPDVTIINYSMMTYGWFGTKHNQYPHLRFPGSHLVPFGSQKGFSFAQFLDANSALMAPKRGGVFFGGKLNYNDADFASAYTFVPFGLLDEIQPVRANALPLTKWYAQQQRTRRIVNALLPGLPPAHKYDDQTWEWTIARDHGMKQLSWSTYLLERTIEEDPQNVTLLAESTLAMEHSFQFEPPQFWTASSNLKNLGLAYAQIVKSNEEFDPLAGDPYLNAVVGQSVQDRTRYKDRASSRMLEVWNAWVRVPEARQDPGFNAIHGIVRQFVPQTHEQNGNTKKKSKKKKKGRKPKSKGQ